MTTTAARNPRYEGHENPPLLASLGYSAQFTTVASATLLVTPIVVARAASDDDALLLWMVFASLLIAGVSTIMQARRVFGIGAGAMLPSFTAAFAIPFCITAVADGGPATLAALVILCGVGQIVISRWLFLMRRVVTPLVGGTVLMVLSITLASVIPRLLPEGSDSDALGAHLAALTTLAVIAALILRGSAVVRLWGPIIGIIAGCSVAAIFGLYDGSIVLDASWVGLPAEWPGLGSPPIISGVNDTFWSLLPAFLFLSVIIAIQANGESIAQQRAAHRESRAVDFREVQGAITGTGVSNLLGGISGSVPIVVNPGAVSYIQTTGIASRRVGYIIGAMLIAMALMPKLSAIPSSIPGPVMAGFLVVLSGYLFVDGARTIIQSDPNRQRLTVAGICFWIGAAFQFGLFSLTDVGSIWGSLLQSGITTGGVAAIIMVLYIELTSPRAARFHSALTVDALPDLTAFVTRFAERRGWDAAMQQRLTAVAEETLLTLAPLDIEGRRDADSEDGDVGADAVPAAPSRQLVVFATSDGPAVTLEFIGGAGDEENMEDRLRQLQQYDQEAAVEQDLSLRLLRAYATSVRHQQYQNTDVITVRVAP